MSLDPRVIAIRNDPKIGRGTCSSVDEGMEDREIIAELDELKITSARAAIRHFRKYERIRDSIADDIRNS